MKKKIMLLVLVGLLVGCGGMYRNKGLNVPVKLERESFENQSVLIFNFKEPDYAQGVGPTFGEMFHLELLKSKKFKIVSLYSNSPWDRLGDSEEERLLNAIEEGKDKDYDYILVGDIRSYYPGALTPSRVRVKVRLIEVKTKTTVLLAENNKSHVANDSNYSMNPRLTTHATTPEALAEKIVKELVNQI